MPPVWIALLAVLVTEPAVEVKGTICRMNRYADRLIVLSDDGKRTNIVLGETTDVTFERTAHRRDDLRLGDRVHVMGVPHETRIEAESVDVQLKFTEALVDALLGLKPPLVGRFGTREAKTEFFSLELPDGKYIRVDARSAYGPKGRVYVSRLQSNDLLELGGEFTSDDLYRASSIRILTNEESSSCKPIAGETKEQRTERQKAEQEFLDGIDPMTDEELKELLAGDEETPPDPQPPLSN